MNSTPNALSADRIDAIRDDLADARATWEIGRGRFNTETTGEYVERILDAVPELLAALERETARAQEATRMLNEHGCAGQAGHAETDLHNRQYDMLADTAVAQDDDEGGADALARMRAARKDGARRAKDA